MRIPSTTLIEFGKGWLGEVQASTPERNASSKKLGNLRKGSIVKCISSVATICRITTSYSIRLNLQAKG